MGTLIRIIIADADGRYRRRLGAYLESQGGFVVVGEADDAEGAVLLAKALAADVVLMDVALPHAVASIRAIAEPGIHPLT